LFRIQPPGQLPLGDPEDLGADDPAGPRPQFVRQLCTHAAGQEELAWRLVAVDRAFHRSKNLWNLLPFIEQDGAGGAAQGSVRVGAVGRGNPRRIEAVHLLDPLRGGGGLTGGAGTGDENSRKLSHQLGQVGISESRTVDRPIRRHGGCRRVTCRSRSPMRPALPTSRHRRS
jgi:hypothetical protein